MEYLPQTLTQWMARGPHGWQDALTRVRQAVDGLCAAHERELIHGDFKPDNVLLGADGRVRVADFGFAHTSARSAGPQSEGAGARSSGGGTRGYAAPEQYVGVVDERSDVFSVCVTVYEMVYGVRPFDSDSDAEYLRDIEGGRLRAPSDGRRVPRWLARAVVRGLAHDPRDRYPSMPALAAALETPRPPWVMLLVGAVALSGLGVGSQMRCGVEEPPPTCVLDPSPLDARLQQKLAALSTSREGWTVAAMLRRGASGWTERREVACDRFAQGVLGPDEFRSRARCLDRHAVELRKLVMVVDQHLGVSEVLVERVLRAQQADPMCMVDLDPLRDPESTDDALADAIDRLIAEAMVELNLGRPRKYREAILEIPEQLGDLEGAPGHALWWRLHLGQAEYQVGHFEVAEQTLRQLVVDAERERGHDPLVLGAAYVHLAQAVLERGEVEQARFFVKAGRASFESAVHGQHHLVLAAIVAARVERQDRNPEVARDYLDQADVDLEEKGLPGVGLFTQERLLLRGLVAQDLGRPAEASAQFQSALAGWGWSFGVDGLVASTGAGGSSVAEALHVVGVFEVRHGDRGAGLAMLSEAAGIHEDLGLHQNAAQDRISLGNWSAGRDLPAALEHFEHAERLLRLTDGELALSSTKDDLPRFELAYDRAITLHYYGDGSADLEAASEGYGVVIGAPPDLRLPLNVRYGALVGRGSVRVRLGEYRRAEADFERALGLEDEWLPTADRLELRLGWSQALAYAGARDEGCPRATEVARGAQRLAEEAGVEAEEALRKWRADLRSWCLDHADVNEELHE